MRGQPAECMNGQWVSRLSSAKRSSPGSGQGPGPRSGGACGDEGATAASPGIPRFLMVLPDVSVTPWLDVGVQFLGVGRLLEGGSRS